MAAKMIRDGMLESERVHSVSVPARWLFATILLLADDLGLIELNHFRLGRRAGLDQTALQPLLTELSGVDLLRPYKVGEKGYAFVPRYGQRLRVKRTKCPLPPLSLLVGDDDALNKIKALQAEALTSGGDVLTDDGEARPEPEPEPEGKANPSLRSGFAPPSAKGAPAKPKRKRPKAGDPPAPSVLAWNGYSAAYLARYKVAPVRNARVNGQLAAFVARIPAAEVEAVAAFFVGHNGNLYVNAKHPVDLLLRDAEKLRTDWATNQRADPGKATESNFARERRTRHAELSGGLASARPPSSTLPPEDIFDVIPDATPRLA